MAEHGAYRRVRFFAMPVLLELLRKLELWNPH